MEWISASSLMCVCICCILHHCTDHDAVDSPTLAYASYIFTLLCIPSFHSVHSSGISIHWQPVSSLNHTLCNISTLPLVPISVDGCLVGWITSCKVGSFFGFWSPFHQTIYLHEANFSWRLTVIWQAQCRCGPHRPVYEVMHKFSPSN